jgi:hypothetical protein
MPIRRTARSGPNARLHGSEAPWAARRDRRHGGVARGTGSGLRERRHAYDRRRHWHLSGTPVDPNAADERRARLDSIHAELSSVITKACRPVQCPCYAVCLTFATPRNPPRNRTSVSEATTFNFPIGLVLLSDPRAHSSVCNRQVSAALGRIRSRRLAERAPSLPPTCRYSGSAVPLAGDRLHGTAAVPAELPHRPLSHVRADASALPMTAP